MFIGVICRSIVFSWAIICVFGQSTPTPHEGDTDGACLGNPCDENGPCFNRPTTVDGKTQYVCECPDNMIYTGDLCDQFGGPTNDKETCFGRDCYVGFFTSPNYPNGYLPRHRKIYTLYAPGAKSVTFTTHENFSVESHKDEFYIGTGLTYPTTLDFVNKTSDPLQYVFQGYTAAPPFSLPGNEFWMIFDTDRTVEFMGWRLDWIAYEQQSFDEEPMSINVTEGDDVMFNCSVLNKQGVMSWSKDGSEIINNDLNMVSSSGRYDIISNVENVEYNLLVQNVDRSSAGSYIAYVSAQNGHSAIQSQAAILVVHTAAIQRFVEQPSDVEIVEGNDTFLKCKIENKEGTVIWYKDGVAISSDASIINGDLRLSIIGDHSAGEYYLAFLGLTVADAGNYSVVVTAADNSPEIRSEEAALTVLRHQWFIRTPESLSIVEGQTLNLHVTVGNKRGTLSWIKDGYIVLNYDLAVAVNDARVSISNPSQGVYDLVITDVTLADAGTYQVSVTGGDSDNPISTTAITLSVNDLETQSFVRTPESAEIAVSSRFVLHSQVDHREGDVIWSRNGVDISLNGAITNGDSRYSITGDPSLGEYHLVIDNVQHSDAGNFKVRVTAADNSPEIESADVGVTTRGPTEPLSDYPKCSLERINNNKTLQLTCESRGGDPPAALEWTRDGSVIVGSIAAASNSTGSKHVLEMESTYSLEGAIFTCVSSHVTFTESKMCMIGPLETGTSRIPDDNFPKCSIANENLILDDSALLICETRGGIPPATLEWSKDGVIYEGQWMNTETETVNGLLLNLTADLEGAVFVCSSDHPSYEETKTCEIGPLKFTSSPWYSSPWIWLLLGLLLLALLILLIILLICCCCCGRRRYCFCADACLAICPCCTCCKGVKHADAATMVETDTADTAIIVHSTYAGSPRKSEISTQTPGYLTEKPLYLLENSHLNASNHVRTDYRSEKIKTRTRDQETGRTRSEADEVEKEDTAKKNAKNKKSLDGEKSKETSGKNADHDARGAEHRESHVTNINETNYYLLPNSSAVTGSTHNAKGDYVTSCSSSDSDKDKDSLGGSGGKKKRKSRKSESRNAQVKRQESDITDDQRRVLNRQHRTRMSVDSFVPLSRPDDRNEPEGGNVEDSMEKTGVKGSAENTGDQKSEAKVDDPRNQKAMKDHHTNLAESQTVDSYRDESETTDNLSRTGGSYAKRKTEQTRTLETEFDGDRKGITMNGHVAMSGITQNELSKLVKKQSKLDASLTAPPTSDYSPRLSHSLTSTTKGDPLSYSINSDNITVGNRRAALRTLSTHLKRRPYRITPDAVRWGKTRPEALAREFPAGSADIEDFEAVRNLRSMRITTDFGIFSAWDPEYTSTTLRLTGGYEDDSEV